eukprot:808600-Rhodomonas_salina.1
MDPCRRGWAGIGGGGEIGTKVRQRPQNCYRPVSATGWSVGVRGPESQALPVGLIGGVSLLAATILADKSALQPDSVCLQTRLVGGKDSSVHTTNNVAGHKLQDPLGQGLVQTGKDELRTTCK